MNEKKPDKKADYRSPQRYPAERNRENEQVPPSKDYRAKQEYPK